ncbi:UNVERIFIED_CONTAM: hypothetical protein HDU68_000912 [Siphonaria sp. JEL0065]|nr:hypothetical protein HDU68_000912 [Siphonaria sp. JEL0065]
MFPPPHIQNPLLLLQAQSNQQHIPEPISQILKRESVTRNSGGGNLQAPVEHQQHLQPPRTLDRDLVASPTNDTFSEYSSTANNQQDLSRQDSQQSVPNVGVFGTTAVKFWKMVETTSSSLYSRVDNAASSTGNGSGRSQMGSLPLDQQRRASSNGSPTRQHVRGGSVGSALLFGENVLESPTISQVGGQQVPDASTVEGAKRNSVVFYDWKVDVTYVVVRVSEVFVLALLFEGAQKGRRVGQKSDSGVGGQTSGAGGVEGRASSGGGIVVEENGQWDSDVNEFVSSFVGKLLHSNVRQLIST